ncbi:branched-chain amino acid ABC transporter substrate-binding protein [Martelella mediterranea]|uniref:Amino acid/amide ABC transporter substrate-binding protein (HAAT family) n=1 Tax=Martelella mediterranea TaxID=293089 RepID=A0A4V6P0A6_9HYPH|nr:branched-chain amino acid ABC transporter substrate-binding protein [Martelella mediterranea]TCT40893.1 amino acid/amide ABC transporter substrate-binding protein (HAAT family) [Martelella mediterranea]
MKRSFRARFTLFLTAMLLAGHAYAVDGGTIGLVTPLSGDYSILGKQLAEGAQLQASHSGAVVTVIDESCEEGSGVAVADQLIAAGAEIAIGFMCSATLRSALPILKDAGIPAITVSVRSTPLMEEALKAGWPLYRMAPSQKDEADELTEIIMSQWADKPVALLDDGTIYFRELINAVRNRIEERGLKPVIVDTFRPAQEQQAALVRRLEQAGATHILIGGTRNDTAIIARDAAQSGASLTILGGDSLRAPDEPVKLENGILAAALPEFATLPPAAEISEDAQQAGINAEGYVVPGAAAVLVATQALNAADSEETDIEKILQTRHFDTPLGPVSFTPEHELSDNPLMLLSWQNGQFVPIFDTDE